MAVERLATKAVLGEAPEDLFFTLEDLDRGVNFFAPTIGRCTDEREPGPLGDVLAQHPMGRLSPDEIQQFAVMQATSVRRAQDAQSGAHRVMMLLFKFGCDRIMEK